MRRFYTFRYLPLLLMLGLATSCDLSGLKDAIIVSEVDDEFYVDFWENLTGPNGRELVIKLESIKSEKCLNYRIDSQFSKESNRLTVNLNSIVKPLDCVAGEATVKQDVNAGNLLNGLYALNINLKSTITNNGQLLVSDNRYALDFQKENGIKFRRKSLLRVPDQAIWGYVEYAQKTDEPNARKFINELSALSGNANDFAAGYYGYFTIAESNPTLSVYEQSALSVPYLLVYQDNEVKIKNLLASYRLTYGSQLKIHFYNAKGENW